MVNLRIALNPSEADALAKLADSERRDPRAQAAYLIRQSLEHLGLLQPTPTSNPSQDEAPHAKT